MARWQDSLVFIGIKGTVLALERATGREVWRTPLKGCGFVNVVLDSGHIFASTQGQIWCLDPDTGGIYWNNPLKGLGFGLVTVAGNDVSAIQEHHRRQEAASSSGAAVG